MQNIETTLSTVFGEELSSILRDGVSVFLFLLLGMFVDVMIELIVPGKAALTYPLIQTIASQAGGISILMTMIFHITKFSLSRGIGLLVRVATPTIETFQTKTIWTYIYDIFLQITWIIAVFPIRPVLQERYSSGSSYELLYIFVRYDLWTTGCILGILAVGIFFMIIRTSTTDKAQKIVLVLFSVALALYAYRNTAFANRISESRGSWAAREYTTLYGKSQTALKDAKTDEEKASALYWMGVSKNRNGQGNEALPLLEEAVKLNPQYYAAFASLSTAYSLTRQFDKARTAAETCIRLQPSYGWCYISMGTMYLYQDDVATGLAWYYKAKSVEPDDKEILNAVTITEAAAISHDPKGAEAAKTKLVP